MKWRSALKWLIVDPGAICDVLRFRWFREVIRLSRLGSYATVETRSNTLLRFNEIPRQLYNCLRRTERNKEEWKVEDFLEGLRRPRL
jgi:hypothetical protein